MQLCKQIKCNFGSCETVSVILWSKYEQIKEQALAREFSHIRLLRSNIFSRYQIQKEHQNVAFLLRRGYPEYMPLTFGHDSCYSQTVLMWEQICIVSLLWCLTRKCGFCSSAVLPQPKESFLTISPTTLPAFVMNVWVLADLKHKSFHMNCLQSSRLRELNQQQ